MLIRFAEIVSKMTPSQRREADRKLAEAMKQASQGVGTIIALGEKLIAKEGALELDNLLNKIKEELPDDVAQWVYTHVLCIVVSLHCSEYFIL